MKFCRPVFRAVNETDSQLAKEIFSKTKEAFHPIARRMIEKVSINACIGLYHAQTGFRTLVWHDVVRMSCANKAVPPHCPIQSGAFALSKNLQRSAIH